MMKYIRLYKAFFRMNLMKITAYRANFWFLFFITGIESAIVFVSVAILFTHINNIAGWSYNEVLVLMGAYMFSQSLAWILFKAGVHDLDTLIQKGDLDGFLVKPVDTQFLISVQRIDIVDAGRSVVGIVLILTGLSGKAILATLLNIPLFILMMMVGQVILYSIMLTLKIISFKSIQGWATNAISWRFHDLAHYPTDIYRGAVRFFYTFVIPLIFIATVPTKALLGIMDVRFFVGGIIAAALSLTLVRMIWKRALRNYSSASS